MEQNERNELIRLVDTMREKLAMATSGTHMQGAKYRPVVVELFLLIDRIERVGNPYGWKDKPEPILSSSNSALRLGQAHIDAETHKNLLVAEAKRQLAEATRETKLKTRERIHASIEGLLDEIGSLQVLGDCPCKHRYDVIRSEKS